MDDDVSGENTPDDERTRPARRSVTLRLSPGGLHGIDERARAERRNRSDMVRLMLEYATKTMPKGWTP